MPYGKYPERVKAFRKWSQERIDKATINDSVTSAGASRPRPQFRRKRRFRRRKKKAQDG